MADNNQQGSRCDNTDAETAALVKECEGFDYVRFVHCSIVGEAYCKLVPARHLCRFLKTGCRIWEGICLFGVGSDLFHDMLDLVVTGNVAMKPMPGTPHLLPWVTAGKYKVGAVLCEQVYIDTGIPLKADARYMACQQIKRLEDRGYNIRAGTELEFILVDKVREEPISDRCIYATCTETAKMEDFIYHVDDQLYQCGVNIENIVKEYSAGQFEFILAPSLGIDASDQVFKMRQALREIADKSGMFPTFMTMLANGVGTGTHFNHSIINQNTKRNMFFDDAKPDNLSDFARHWIGGLMKHAFALTALCCPTVNCYRRIGAPWAPAKPNWGLDDRHATYRVKNGTEAGTYMENRLPGGAANPYIVMAATIAAGLDGVESKIECPPATSLEETKPLLPGTLVDALEALKADEVMCKALGYTFLEWFLVEKTGSQFPVFPKWSRDDTSEEQFSKERKFFMKYI